MKYWEKDLWVTPPNPSDYTTMSVRSRVRYNSILAPGPYAFLTAHPSPSAPVHSSQWPIMLRRHLDVPGYLDSITPLI